MPENHGVSFEKASSVFYHEFAVQFYDNGHSELEEDCYLILGVSNKSRMLMICHCEKQSGNVLRIISARKATKNELRAVIIEYVGFYNQKRLHASLDYMKPVEYEVKMA